MRLYDETMATRRLIASCHTAFDIALDMAADYN